MTRVFRILTLVLLLLLAACSQVDSVSRNQVAENLSPMLRLERRAEQLKYYTQWLVLARGLDDDKIADLKARHDVYFVYYLAANVNLAGGNLRSYYANLNRAEEELSSMEATLKNSLTEFGQTESKTNSRIPRMDL